MIVIQFWSLFKRDDKVYAFAFLACAELPFASLGELVWARAAACFCLDTQRMWLVQGSPLSQSSLTAMSSLLPGEEIFQSDFQPLLSSFREQRELSC